MLAQFQQSLLNNYFKKSKKSGSEISEPDFFDIIFRKEVGKNVHISLFNK